MKRYIPLIFVLLFPYYVVFEINSLVHSFVGTIYYENEWLFILSFLLVLVVAQITSAALALISIIMKWPVKELLRANMILKLALIPGYILIFLIGFCSLDNNIYCVVIDHYVYHAA